MLYVEYKFPSYDSVQYSQHLLLAAQLHETLEDYLQNVLLRKKRSLADDLLTSR